MSNSFSNKFYSFLLHIFFQVQINALKMANKQLATNHSLNSESKSLNFNMFYVPSIFLRNSFLMFLGLLHSLYLNILKAWFLRCFQNISFLTSFSFFISILEDSPVICEIDPMIRQFLKKWLGHFASIIHPILLIHSNFDTWLRQTHYTIFLNSHGHKMPQFNTLILYSFYANYQQSLFSLI